MLKKLDHLAITNGSLSSSCPLLQDTWTDAYSILHADVHQSYVVDGLRELPEGGIAIRFSRERKSCDLQDYHIDVSSYYSY